MSSMLDSLRATYPILWLTLLHSERQKLRAILAFLSAVGLTTKRGRSLAILAFLIAIGLEVKTIKKNLNSLYKTDAPLHLLQKFHYVMMSLISCVNIWE